MYPLQNRKSATEIIKSKFESEKLEPKSKESTSKAASDRNSNLVAIEPQTLRLREIKLDHNITIMNCNTPWSSHHPKTKTSEHQRTLLPHFTTPAAL